MTRLVDDIDLLATVEGDSLHDGRGRPRRAHRARRRARRGHPRTTRGASTRTREGVILGDQDRLLQAWLQLADNAAKYTPAGAPIEIGSRLDADGAQPVGARPRPGHPARRRGTASSAASTARTASASVGGSGLGLAIVDAITKGHGGHVRRDRHPRRRRDLHDPPAPADRRSCRHRCARATSCCSGRPPDDQDPHRRGRAAHRRVRQPRPRIRRLRDRHRRGRRRGTRPRAARRHRPRAAGRRPADDGRLRGAARAARAGLGGARSSC